MCPFEENSIQHLIWQGYTESVSGTLASSIQSLRQISLRIVTFSVIFRLFCAPWCHRPANPESLVSTSRFTNRLAGRFRHTETFHHRQRARRCTLEIVHSDRWSSCRLFLPQRRDRRRQTDVLHRIQRLLVGLAKVGSRASSSCRHVTSLTKVQTNGLIIFHSCSKGGSLRRRRSVANRPVGTSRWGRKLRIVTEPFSHLVQQSSSRRHEAGALRFEPLFSRHCQCLLRCAAFHWWQSIFVFLGRPVFGSAAFFLVRVEP